MELPIRIIQSEVANALLRFYVNLSSSGYVRLLGNISLENRGLIQLSQA